MAFLKFLFYLLLIGAIGYSGYLIYRNAKSIDSNITLSAIQTSKSKSTNQQQQNQAEQQDPNASGTIKIFEQQTNKDDSSQDGGEANILQSNNQQTKQTLSFPGILPEVKTKNKKAVITTSRGLIEFDLLVDNSPKTVSNFIYLAETGFYNGLVFHRVEPSFVVQTGDPLGNGRGGPGYSFEDEPIIGDYLAGTVAMANAGPNTNGSQFFICLADLPSLPKQYNLFGRVTKGMNIVQQLKVGDKMESVVIASNENQD